MCKQRATIGAYVCAAIVFYLAKIFKGPKLLSISYLMTGLLVLSLLVGSCQFSEEKETVAEVKTESSFVSISAFVEPFILIGGMQCI